MLHKILVPLDGSELAERALPYAESLAEKYQAELILVLVLQAPTVPVVVEPYGGAAFYEHQIQDMTENRETAQAIFGKAPEKIQRAKYNQPG